MRLLALRVSKELAVAANTIISSSLHNEVMLANHKAVCHARCKITDTLSSFQRLSYGSFTWSH